MQPPAIDAHQQFWNPERVPPLGRDDFSLDAIGREAVLARTPDKRLPMALTDQAIEKIKDLIVSGEFVPGSKLPKERELAERLGLSRNSLREAVRALTLIGVLEPRQGDGTYVTSLEPELLLAGTTFVSDLLTGATVLELHEVRRILEPAATAMAATRLSEAELQALRECLERMDAAESTQSFIDSDVEFHRIIVGACGNATLASLIQSLSGGTLRARIWRAINERRRSRQHTAAAPRHLPLARRPRSEPRRGRRPDPPRRRGTLAASPPRPGDPRRLGQRRRGLGDLVYGPLNFAAFACVTSAVPVSTLFLTFHDGDFQSPPIGTASAHAPPPGYSYSSSDSGSISTL
jgi:GntR family transcriptional regulator, transcriptional repressor for pyruvate dehydrogenase complex